MDVSFSKGFDNARLNFIFSSRKTDTYTEWFRWEVSQKYFLWRAFLIEITKVKDSQDDVNLLAPVSIKYTYICLFFLYSLLQTTSTHWCAPRKVDKHTWRGVGGVEIEDLEGSCTLKADHLIPMPHKWWYTSDDLMAWSCFSVFTLCECKPVCDLWAIR